MKQIESMFFYVEGKPESAALKRAVEYAKAAGAKFTLGTVVQAARSQPLITGDRFDH